MVSVLNKERSISSSRLLVDPSQESFCPNLMELSGSS